MRLALAFATVFFFAAFMASGGWFFVEHHGNITQIACTTPGASLKSRTKDHNLHITYWCVKNGRVVQ